VYRPADVGGVLVGEARDKIVGGYEKPTPCRLETLEGAQAGNGVGCRKVQPTVVTATSSASKAAVIECMFETLGAAPDH
jgi:hypothetical protein